jgi:hypothetical protein
LSSGLIFSALRWNSSNSFMTLLGGSCSNPYALQLGWLQVNCTYRIHARASVRLLSNQLGEWWGLDGRGVSHGLTRAVEETRFVLKDLALPLAGCVSRLSTNRPERSELGQNFCCYETRTSIPRHHNREIQGSWKTEARL